MDAQWVRWIQMNSNDEKEVGGEKAFFLIVGICVMIRRA
jgi:hypothetical protein